MLISLDKQPMTKPKIQASKEPVAITQGARALITLFVVSLLIPSNWEIAGFAFGTARIYALCMLIPLAMRWIAQEAGRPLPIDVLLLLHGFWIVVSLVVNHGTERIAVSVMTTTELLCGYLVGRILIRNPACYRFLFQVLLIFLLILVPFALYEMGNGRAVMQELFNSLLGSAHDDIQSELRMGFERAQSVMQHPILWGVFCAMVISNAFYIWRDSLPAACLRVGVAGLACFSSLSAGAILNAVIQICLVAWGWATKGAWKLLVIGFVAVYVFLSLASNRGPIILMIETMTFNAGTGWTRVLTWQHGIDDVLANPIFGIGFHDHTRPVWLVRSVDNFWLVVMLRHGFVGFGLLAAGFLWHIWKVVTAEGLSGYERRLREGYMIAMVALLFSLSTVHFWGPPYLLMFAYIGAGVWFYAGREPVPAPVTQAYGNLDGDMPPESEERRARDMPFARSFVSSEMRQHDLPRGRPVPSTDSPSPSPKTCATPPDFNRRDIHKSGQRYD